jgi:hypothetical protein
MPLILDLANPVNWNQVYSTTVAAVFIGSDRYAPIPKITVPVLLESQVVACYVTCLPDKPTWRFAAWMNQNIQTGLTIGGLTDAENVQRRKIWLRKITLARLEKLSENYSISFDVPSWFQSVSLQVWEYTGVIEDSTEDLINQIRDNELPRLEQKIDDLLTYGGG